MANQQNALLNPVQAGSNANNFLLSQYNSQPCQPKSSEAQNALESHLCQSYNKQNYYPPEGMQSQLQPTECSQLQNTESSLLDKYDSLMKKYIGTKKQGKAGGASRNFPEKKLSNYESLFVVRDKDSKKDKEMKQLRYSIYSLLAKERE